MERKRKIMLKLVGIVEEKNIVRIITLHRPPNVVEKLVHIRFRLYEGRLRMYAFFYVNIYE